MRPSTTAVIASCARPTPRPFRFRPRRSPDRLVRFLRLFFSRRCTHSNRVRATRPLGEFFWIVVEPVGHAPIGGQLVLAVLCRIAKGAESFLLEIGNRFGVSLQIN